MGAGGASSSFLQSGQRISVNTWFSPGWDVRIRYGKAGVGRLASSASRIRLVVSGVGAWLGTWLTGCEMCGFVRRLIIGVNGGHECNMKSISHGVGGCLGVSDGLGRVCEGRLNGSSLSLAALTAAIVGLAAASSTSSYPTRGPCTQIAVDPPSPKDASREARLLGQVKSEAEAKRARRKAARERQRAAMGVAAGVS